MAEVAEAFSGHRFTQVYPQLSDDVRWTILGNRTIVGKAAVIATCDESAAYLATVTTEFSRFKLVVGEDIVVVDSRAAYVDAEGTKTTIASCDVYEFVDDSLAEITSYTVDLS